MSHPARACNNMADKMPLYCFQQLKVCGSVGLPTPAARYSHEAGTLALGEGAFQLHVAEVNAVLKL